MTKREAAIISAYPGYLIGDFREYHSYAETLFGETVTPGLMGDISFQASLQELSKPDFLAIEVKS